MESSIAPVPRTKDLKSGFALTFEKWSYIITFKQKTLTEKVVCEKHSERGIFGEISLCGQQMKTIPELLCRKTQVSVDVCPR